MSDYLGVARPDRIYNYSPRSVLAGAGVLTAAMYNFNKRSRSSQETTGSSLTQASTALEVIHGNHELITRKREPASSYRLHRAKFLVMDKMLKSLFFPLNTTQLRFGISSFTGSNLSNINDKTVSSAGSTSDDMRPRGLYRGLCMFDVRNTDYDADRQSENALNCKLNNVGGVSVGGTVGDITSVYRRFHSRPSQTAAFDGGPIQNNGPPVFTTVDTASPNTLRSISLGTNLNDIEEAATSGMCYADPQVAFYKSRDITPGNPTPTQFTTNQESNNTGLLQDQDPALNGGDPSSLTSTSWTGPDKEHYWGRFKDAVVRIVDGSVELDIMNTEHSPCVVELVIHSRKGGYNRGKQFVYQQLWQDVERHLNAKNVHNPVDGTANPVGGWQAFFDPTYPLLKIPSKGEANRYVNEVHRSNHVLAPGQSKKVKIALGNLWYKIGSKVDTNIGETDFAKEKNSNGTLYFSIGHSGFEYPQTVSSLGNEVTGVFTSPSVQTAGKFGDIAGTGFWVGKANAPSSISVDGSYTDKFYPLTFDRQPQSVYSAGLPRVAAVNGLGGTASAAVPLSTIVAQRVATGDDTVVQEL